MSEKKKEHAKVKTRLHNRNKHRERYNFKELVKSCPELAQYVKLNVYNDESIDFFNSEAVKTLNKALLKHYYGVDYWDIPDNYLCPPIPGRADYIHHISDLLSNGNFGHIPKGNKIKCLDIGVGANCVYPIIASKVYGWTVVGSDIDPVAIESASKIVEMNPSLQDKVEIRLQANASDIFKGIIKDEELFDLTICNPPFHSSLEEAQAGTVRKLSNLTHKEITEPSLNFGGQNNELWCKGGEEKFVRNMIHQSKQFGKTCLWFSTLISKQKHLDGAYKELDKAGAYDVKTIPMGQGNKTSRIIAWTFQSVEHQKEWVNSRWNEQ